MPELPEVQTVVDDLRAAGLPGREIVDLDVQWPPSIGGESEVFRNAVVGRTITDLARRGKWMLLLTEYPGTAATPPAGTPAAILVHLRMSGRLYLSQCDDPLTGYERVRLFLDDQRELRFHDPRKFGRVLYTPDPQIVLSRLGMEPLDPTFTVEALGGLLRARRRQLKPLLLDQHVMAGLGNIYTDEALWRAQIHPQRLSNSLSVAEIGALHEAIPAVLRRGIKNLGTSLASGQSNFILPGDARRMQAHPDHVGARNQEELQVFQQTGRPCPRCRVPIVRIIVGQRATHICPVCQRSPD
jgi:formamidopyrimidine-DNA glycosylase